jgi:hypothetical protein
LFYRQLIVETVYLYRMVVVWSIDSWLLVDCLYNQLSIKQTTTIRQR